MTWIRTTPPLPCDCDREGEGHEPECAVHATVSVRELRSALVDAIDRDDVPVRIVLESGTPNWSVLEVAWHGFDGTRAAGYLLGATFEGWPLSGATFALLSALAKLDAGSIEDLARTLHAYGDDAELTAEHALLEWYHLVARGETRDHLPNYGEHE